MAFQLPLAQQNRACKGSSDRGGRSHSLLRIRSRQMEDQVEMDYLWDIHFPHGLHPESLINSSISTQKWQQQDKSPTAGLGHSGINKWWWKYQCWNQKVTENINEWVNEQTGGPKVQTPSYKINKY